MTTFSNQPTPEETESFDMWAEANTEAIDAAIAAMSAEDLAESAAWLEREERRERELQEVVTQFESLGGEFIRADGCVPFQAEGRWRGFVFYFRSRHDRWTLSVGPATLGVEDICFGGLVIAHGDDDDVWTQDNWADASVGFTFAVKTLDQWIDAGIDALPVTE